MEVLHGLVMEAMPLIFSFVEADSWNVFVVSYTSLYHASGATYGRLLPER